MTIRIGSMSNIDKAIGKYNQSGCKAVYIVEIYRNERFGVSWNHSIRNIVKHPKINER